eukprot:1160914-Pelagomonas_calceolata.AAC.25
MVSPLQTVCTRTLVHMLWLYAGISYGQKLCYKDGERFKLIVQLSLYRQQRKSLLTHKSKCVHMSRGVQAHMSKCTLLLDSVRLKMTRQTRAMLLLGKHAQTRMNKCADTTAPPQVCPNTQQPEAHGHNPQPHTCPAYCAAAKGSCGGVLLLIRLKVARTHTHTHSHTPVKLNAQQPGAHAVDVLLLIRQLKVGSHEGLIRLHHRLLWLNRVHGVVPVCT